MGGNILVVSPGYLFLIFMCECWGKRVKSKSQRRMLGAFLNGSLPYSLETESCTKQEACLLGRDGCLMSTQDLPFLLLPPQCWVTGTCSYACFLYKKQEFELRSCCSHKHSFSPSPQLPAPQDLKYEKIATD